MAITRIKNNQITDTTITGAKIVGNTLTAGLLENDLTYGSNLTVSGNLTVNGTTHTINTTNTSIEDAIIRLASQQAGAGGVDIGFIGERGTDTNIAFVWDESADAFVTGFTSDADSSTTVVITGKADLQVAGLDTTGTITANALTVTPGATNVVILNATGLASLDGGIDVDGVFTVAGDGSGNVATTGTLGAGATTVSTLAATGLASLNGGIAVDGTNFTVNGTSGAISTTSTLAVTGISTLGVINASGLASLDAGIDVDGVFTVAGDGSGNVATTGTLGAGATTVTSATISNLTDNRIPVTGTSGLLGDDANLTFDGTTFEVGTLFDVTVASGNTAVGGTLTVTGATDLNDALTTKDISVEAVASVTAGSFVVGETYIITAAGTTDFTLIGAADSVVGTQFTATGAGTGTGTADLVQILDAGGNVWTNLADPVNAQDAATRSYVNSVSNTGFTFTGDTGTTTISGSDTQLIQGTSLEIETAVSGDTMTIGLPASVTITTALTSSGTLGVTGVSTLGVINASGLASLDGGIDVDGLFTVGDGTGNTVVGGTLGVTGISTLTGDLVANGDADLNGYNTLSGFRVDGTSPVTAGSFVVGVTYEITTAGSTDFTAIGAADSNVGTIFTASGVGTGTGTATAGFVSMGTNRVSDVADPTLAQDAATKNYVDGLTTSGFDIAGDTGTDTVPLATTLTISGSAGEIETAVTDNVITIGLPTNVDIDGTLATGGLATLASASVTGALDINGATTLTNTTWDGSSTIDAGANRITNVDPVPTADTDAASKIYVDNLVTSSTIWKDPVVDSDLVELAAANPGTMASLITAYSLAVGDNVSFISTAAFTFDAGGVTVISAAAGDIVNLTVVSGTVGDYSVVETPLTAGDRFIIAAEHGTIGAVLTTLAMADTFTLADGDLIEYGGGTITLAASWTTPNGRSGNAGGGTEMVQGVTVLNADPDSVHYGHTFFYDAVGNVWIEISGPGSIAAGTNLAYTGNTLNVSPQGTGSGLDSDQLDGNEGTYFLDWANFTSIPTVTYTLSGDVSGTVASVGLGGAVTIANTIVADDSHNHTKSFITDFTESEYIHAAGDLMDSAANLTFSGNGEVLGLPATPSGNTAASSKLYVDNQIAAGFTVAADSGTPDVIPGQSTLTINGTSLEIETLVSAQNITIGLPAAVTVTTSLTSAALVSTGTLGVTGISTLGVVNASGLASLDGGIDVDGVFTVTNGTGAISTNSTLGVTGISTLTGLLNANGGIAVDSTAFTVADTSGNVATSGTLDVANLASLDGGIDVDAAFTVANTTGDVVTSGDLTVAGATDLNGTNTFSGFTVDATSAVTAGTFVVGETYEIITTGTTDYTLIGAADSLPGTIFTASGAGTGTGTATAGFVSMGTNRISDVVDPVLDQDAATKGYVDSAAATSFSIDGDLGTGTSSISSGNTLLITGTSNEIETTVNTGVDTVQIGLPASVTIASVLTVSGQADVDNVTINGNDIAATAGTELTINEAGGDFNFRVEGDTDINALFVDAGTNSINIGTATALTDVKFQVATTGSMIGPKGITAERPAVGIAGMFRYNTSINEYEYYDGTTWAGFGETFTVIASEAFVGTGAQTVYTLATTQTTASCIVSINGVLQLPTTAYAVSGTTLTFTEAPANTDDIEVREITTTTSIVSVTNGNAELTAVGSSFELTGSVVPTVNNTYDIGTGALKVATVYATTFSGEATSAQYADLAEMYSADTEIAPGTVVCFGGTAEVTTCGTDADPRVAGIVSTNPAYLMNSEADGVAVALRGRVPCKVSGSIKKGDMLVSDGNGGARAEASPALGTVIAKALEDSEGEAVIEVVV